MSKISMRFIFAFILALLSITAPAAQDADQISSDKVWEERDPSALNKQSAERTVVPEEYKTFRLSKTRLQTILDRAPQEFTEAARSEETVLTIPMPDGSFARFRILESSVMAPELAAKYSQIKSYRGEGLDDPTAIVRLDLSPFGFRVMVISAAGTSYVEPYARGNTSDYISFDKKSLSKTSDFKCLTETEAVEIDPSQLAGKVSENLVINGTTLRTYRLALAATGEYTNRFRQTGDTDAQAKQRALAQMNTTMNRVNGVFLRELSIQMVLVANTDLLIYTDPATDPYTNSSGNAMLGENQANINSVIGTANYDIGHVFSTGGGGVANLRAPCGANKARGVTGASNPVGDFFAIDYVAHEMGHQFGADHTFNSSVNGCGDGNRASSAAYEPGSGSTIMGYAGLCSPQNLQPFSSDYFHVKSLEEIVSFINGSGGCSTNTATNNSAPTVAALGGVTSYNIPRGTPFTLTAVGGDANGDSLTYTWEEYDLGSAATSSPNSDADGSARPIFRSYLPTGNPSRTFPSLQYILNNANVPPTSYNCSGLSCMTGELLPSITRTMNFQATARDNRAGGGAINTTMVQVAVSGNSGPFRITQPNAAASLVGGSAQAITWDVAGTTDAPVNATRVRILLSADGGQTFPTVLADNTPNDGVEFITVPNIVASTVRLKIEAVGNIFFDISDANLSIQQTKTPFDFDGDNRADVSVFRPDNGTWFLLRSSQGATSLQFGLGTDKPVPADFDGDGRTDVAVFRDGNWYILNSGNGQFRAVQFGQAGDVPLPADYDADGKADIAVFRSGTWYVVYSGNSQFVATQFGQAGDRPVPADYDGDGRADIAVYRDGFWYLLRSSQGFTAVQFGIAADKPVVGDYDGDKKADQAVYRNGTWYLLRSQAGFTSVQFGAETDQPTAADYDGDGKADIAVFRSGTWYLLNSLSGYSFVSYGAGTDKPVPASFVP